MAKIELADGFAEMASTFVAVEVDLRLDGSESTYPSGPHPDLLDAGDRNPMSVAA